MTSSSLEVGTFFALWQLPCKLAKDVEATQDQAALREIVKAWRVEILGPLYKLWSSGFDVKRQAFVEIGVRGRLVEALRRAPWKI